MIHLFSTTTSNWHGQSRPTIILHGDPVPWAIDQKLMQIGCIGEIGAAEQKYLFPSQEGFEKGKKYLVKCGWVELTLGWCIYSHESKLYLVSVGGEYPGLNETPQGDAIQGKGIWSSQEEAEKYLNQCSDPDFRDFRTEGYKTTRITMCLHRE